MESTQFLNDENFRIEGSDDLAIDVIAMTLT